MSENRITLQYGLCHRPVTFTLGPVCQDRIIGSCQKYDFNCSSCGQHWTIERKVGEERLRCVEWRRDGVVVLYISNCDRCGGSLCKYETSSEDGDWAYCRREMEITRQEKEVAMKERKSEIDKLLNNKSQTTFLLSERAKKKGKVIIFTFLAASILVFLLGVSGIFAKPNSAVEFVINICPLSVGTWLIWVSISAMGKLNKSKVVLDGEGIEVLGSLFTPNKFLAWDEVDEAVWINTSNRKQLQLSSSTEGDIIIRDEFEGFDDILILSREILELYGLEVKNGISNLHKRTSKR